MRPITIDIIALLSERTRLRRQLRAARKCLTYIRNGDCMEEWEEWEDAEDCIDAESDNPCYVCAASLGLKRIREAAKSGGRR